MLLAAAAAAAEEEDAAGDELLVSGLSALIGASAGDRVTRGRAADDEEEEEAEPEAGPAPAPLPLRMLELICCQMEDSREKAKTRPGYEGLSG